MVQELIKDIETRIKKDYNPKIREAEKILAIAKVARSHLLDIVKRLKLIKEEAEK